MRTTTGKVGVALLLVQVAVSLYVVSTYPLDFGRTVWNDPAQWADHPKTVAPAWVAFLLQDDRVKHTILDADSPEKVESHDGGVETRVYGMDIPYDYSGFPSFLSFSLSDVTYYSSPPQMSLSLLRPDGLEIVLLRHSVPGPQEGESLPVRRYDETPWRVSLSANDTVLSNVAPVFRREFGTGQQELRGSLAEALFGVPASLGPASEVGGVPGPDSSAPRGSAGTPGFAVLKGDYRALVEFRVFDPNDSIGPLRFVIGGAAFGAMGTDGVGRDLAQGLLFGLPVALFIGIMTSVLTTAVGATLGIMSGYMGGWVDTLIQRLADIIANVPLLPILIFLVFILGSKLFLIIIILASFSWPGMTILIRSMVLQIKSSQFIEAAVGLGSSKWRIMLRHIFPWTAPFVLSQMIFFTPAAILAEAGLSFLGLGDPTIPTWGQILEQGFRTGAVYLGHWWWILPPGILIVITAVTFALLALGMERVVNPRLRSMR